MKTVTIYPPIKIFPDEKFCAYSIRQSCEFLGNKTHWNFCRQFSVLLNYYADKPTKCDQCKSAYNRALEAEKQDHCPTCGN